MSTTQPDINRTELALFDLDHTILDVDSDYLWGEYLVKHELIDVGAYQSQNQKFYDDYIAGTLDSTAYAEFSAGLLAQHDMDTLHQWRADYLEQDVFPHIRPQALQAIDAHRQAGHIVVLISATNDFIVNPIASKLGIPVSHVIATPYAIENDRYTGKLAGLSNFKDGKPVNLARWIERYKHEHGIDSFAHSTAYSDSINDLPLLEWADTPVCVTPDDQLKAHALAHRWAIEDWSL